MRRGTCVMRNLRSEYRGKLDYEILNVADMKLCSALNGARCTRLRVVRNSVCLYGISAVCIVGVIMKIAAIIPMRRSQL